jgi:hypothetical protein
MKSTVVISSLICRSNNHNTLINFQGSTFAKHDSTYQNKLPVLLRSIYNVEFFLLRSRAFGQVGWQGCGREVRGTGVVGHVINSV